MKWTRWFHALALFGPVAPALGADITVPVGGSISAALASANEGDRVLVQGGTYYEHVTLKDGVELRGGYDGSFVWSALLTVIHGSASGPAITSGPAVGSGTIVDGFVLSGGGGSPGAAVLVNGGSPVFSNNTISETYHTGAAGGVYVFGGSTARFQNNRIRNNSSLGSGGGMRIESSSVVLVGNSFDSNTAPHYGAGLYAVSSILECTNNAFRGNQAGMSGGGVYLQHCSDVTIAGSDFEGNTATYGGGVCLRDETTALLEDNRFADCVASEGGGGVAALNYSTLDVMDSRFEDCRAASGGGGLWANQSTVNLIGADAASPSSSTSFTDCGATGAAPRGTGGGVALLGCSGVVRGVRFTNCDADSMGGGLYTLNSLYTIELNVFESCSAPDGGGLVLYSTNTPVPGQEQAVVNNTLWGCEATGGSGDPAGGVLFLSPTSISRFGTVNGNIVANVLQGACLRCRRSVGAAGSGSPLLMGCNSLEIAAGNPALPIPGGGANACVQAFGTSETNRVEDPRFCSSPPTDYTLQVCSPAVGTNDCTAKADRGAGPDGIHCACGSFFSVEASTWGKIKSLYR